MGIGSIEAKGVTSQADYEAVNAALGKAIASVPKSQVMDVYNALAKVVPGAVPNMMFNMVNPLDANPQRRLSTPSRTPCRRFSAEWVEWRGRSCIAACVACILRGCGFRSMYSLGAVLAVSRDSMPITLTAVFSYAVRCASLLAGRSCLPIGAALGQRVGRFLGWTAGPQWESR